jgi:hypothetical protein
MEQRMSDYTISIPDKLYERARRVAQQTSRNVDDVLRSWLEAVSVEPSFDLPEGEYNELKAMAQLSDDTLWTIAREQLPKAVQAKMTILMTNNTQGIITDTEYAELVTLVERGNRLTLRKAHAMKYLTQRGYSITLDDLTPAANE